VVVRELEVDAESEPKGFGNEIEPKREVRRVRVADLGKVVSVGETRKDRWEGVEEEEDKEGSAGWSEEDADSRRRGDQGTPAGGSASRSCLMASMMGMYGLEVDRPERMQAKEKKEGRRLTYKKKATLSPF
jgi:hypothetical protein